MDALGGLPASFGQERAWLLQQLDPTSPLYESRVGLQLRGRLHLESLAEAFDAVVRRHETLRTVFVAPEGRPLQVVLPELAPTRLRVVELPGATDEEVLAALAAEFPEPADLERGPLLRAVVFRLGEHDHVLGISVHNCVADVSSLRLLGNELLEHYAAFVEGRVPEVPPLRTSYSRHATRERERLEEGGRDLAFWRARFGDPPPRTELPTDRPRTALRRRDSASLERVLDPRVAEELQALSAAENATPFVVGLAAFVAVVARHSGHDDDVVVALPVTGRSRPEVEDLIGSFMNVLALRVAVGECVSFRDLVEHVKRVTFEAYAHHEVPFQRVVQEVGAGRGDDANPFTTVAFALGPEAAGPEHRPWGGLEARVIAGTDRIAAFDATLVLRQLRGETRCDWDYATELFDPPTIEAFADRFERFLANALDDPDVCVSEIPLLGESEERFLVHELNRTEGPAPQATLDGLVEAQARRMPDAPAVTCAGTTLTYAELAARMNRLARLLLEHGVRPEDRVAICFERSVDLVVAMLAVPRAGAAYVPLEPSHPRKRLRLLLEDSGAALVLTTAALRSRLPVEGRTTLCVDELDPAPAAEEPFPADPSSLAYVVYTSGTTGMPKGVAVAHRQAVNVLDWVNGTFGVGPGDRLLFVTAPGFDLSVYDVFGALAAGAEVVVATDEEVRDPDRLLELLHTREATIWDSAPAALQQLMLVAEARKPAPAESLRLVLLSGDWVPLTLPDRARAAFPRASVVALGGATEATIWSNAFVVGAVDPDWPSIPYGMPIRNARYYVLGRALRPVPALVPGDLYIGGDVLARGYHARPGLTASAFLPDPYAAAPGGRMYATGDRARIHPDGTIEFLGRLDDQVKIRGFRVEITEVEAALAAHPEVAACAVVATGPREERTLVAYVVCTDGTPTPTELREHLAKRLPAYMIPGRFVASDELPLTANGKLDRGRLPDLAPADRPDPDGRPQTPTEIAVAEIWKALLGHASVRAHDNFFEIGGHSLLALQVVLAARERFGADLPGGILIANQTLREFAAAIDASLERANGSSALQRLRVSGDGPAVVLVHPVGGGVACYAELVAQLPDHDIYTFEAHRPPNAGLTELAAEYVEELQRAGPRVPYVLGGWSLGARLAFEMALQLADTGEEPPLLLVDPLGAKPPAEQLVVTEEEMVRAFVHDFFAVLGADVPAGLESAARDRDAALRAAFEHAQETGSATGLGLDDFVRRYEIFHGNSRAILNYETRLDRAAAEGEVIYDAPVHLVESETQETTVDLFLSVCADVSTLRLEGGHFDVLRGANAERLAEIVEHALRGTAMREGALGR